MQIALLLLYISIFITAIILLPFFKIKGINKFYLPIIFIIKFIIGIGLTWIYTNHYPDRAEADIFKYYDDGYILSKVYHKDKKLFFKAVININNESPELKKEYKKLNFWYRKWENTYSQNDNHIVIRANALIHLISGHYYLIHVLFMSFISFVGLFMIYRIFHHLSPPDSPILLFTTFLIPSLLLWTSGVLKETILFLGLGLFLNSLWQFFNQKNLLQKAIHTTLFIISIFILLQIKSYILILLLPILVPYLINKAFNLKKIFTAYLCSFTLIGLILLVSHLVIPDFSLIHIISLKQNNFFGIAEMENSGSLLYCPQINDSYFQFLKAIPYSIYNVFFQPSPFIFEDFLKFSAGIENTLLLLFPISAIIFFSKEKYKANRNTVWGCFLFCFPLFILIGATTPIAGAIVRYKIPGILFFCYGCILLTDTSKIKKLKIFHLWEKSS